jgi:hypothetical protein
LVDSLRTSAFAQARVDACELVLRSAGNWLFVSCHDSMVRSKEDL